MSGIVLSASVRQNLLSLQSTADLLATTQNRLSTGKKVNTALDNPTNYFTAQALDSRASDISNLLDGIGNGVQILQAANTGITSLQKLVDTAKSIANQALQTTVGYSTKSNVSTTIPGATPADLRGTTTYTSAIGDQQRRSANGTAGGASPITSATTLGGVAASLVGTASTGRRRSGQACEHADRCSDTTGTAATALLRHCRSPRTATSSSSTARPSPSRRARLRPRPPLPAGPASAATSSPTATATPSVYLGTSCRLGDASADVLNGGRSRQRRCQDREHRGCRG